MQTPEGGPILPQERRVRAFSPLLSRSACTSRDIRSTSRERRIVSRVRPIVLWALSSSRFEEILEVGIRPRFSAQETVMPDLPERCVGLSLYALKCLASRKL